MAHFASSFVLVLLLVNQHSVASGFQVEETISPVAKEESPNPKAEKSRFSKVDGISSAPRASTSALNEDLPDNVDTAMDGEVYVEYHGQRVLDRFRYLEEPSSKTKKWLKKQQRMTKSFFSLRKCGKLHWNILWAALKTSIVKWAFCPTRMGQQYQCLISGCFHLALYIFFSRWIQKRMGLGMHSYWVLLSHWSDSKPASVLLRGVLQIETVAPSPSGKFLACSVRGLSSQPKTIRLFKTHSVNPFSRREIIKGVHQFSANSWTSDNGGFFYGRCALYQDEFGDVFEDPNYTDFFYHKIGSHQRDDVLVYESDSMKDFPLQVSNCGSYAMIKNGAGGIRVAPLHRLMDGLPSELSNNACSANLSSVVSSSPPLLWNYIQAGNGSQLTYISNCGSSFLFRSNMNKADQWKVVSVNISETSENGQYSFHDVIEENDLPLESVHALGKGLLWLQYITRDAHSLCVISDAKGNIEHSITLPGGGHVSEVSAHLNSTDVFFMFSSFTNAGTMYHLDLNTFKQRVLHQNSVSGLSPDLFETLSLKYQSTGGEEPQVPMTILRRKDSPAGPRLTILCGYGGYGISMLPRFISPILLFVKQHNAQIAIAHIRGGGELGVKWWREGARLKIQNSFNDVINAAEFLHNEGYTTPAKLALVGQSHGGLVVSACLNQRPDLFACVVCARGYSDMLRYHTFTSAATGMAHYGDPEQCEKDFEAIMKYSPIHNVIVPDEGVPFPAVLLCAGARDGRVVPLHAYKYAAELQRTILEARPDHSAPILLRVSKYASHDLTLMEAADIFAFIVKSTATHPKADDIHKASSHLLKKILPCGKK